MSRFDSLGDAKEVSLEQGPLRYRERGSGETVVFVHGLLVNGDLWRNVVPRVADGFRCLTPDLPLGSHDAAMHADADLSPPGLARLLVGFLDALGIERATFVGNDTGGATVQVLAAAHPQRVARMILTPSDCFDIFPPSMFAYLKVAARVPGLLWLLAQTTRSKTIRNSPLGFGWLAKRPIEDRAARSYIEPALRGDRGVGRDVAKVIAGLDPRHTLEAARRLESFGAPALLVWAKEDRLFPVAYAERLARAMPDARLELVEDSYTFVPEDRPEELARLIREFLEARRPSADLRVAGGGAPRPGFPAS